MDETVILILLVVVMFVGSYLAGNIPIVVQMSEERLQLVSTLGAGLLVGTALAVIIPEGVRSLDFSPHIHNTSPGKKDGESVSVHKAEEHSTDVYSLIGVSLVLGFVFMLLVDQCSSSRGKDVEGATKPIRNITATLGLVVHAAVDGVALGAAATTAQADVEMIVFLAIMLHKAPAAFGLVTFLLNEGMLRSSVKKHLFVFSASAPTTTLLTYFSLGQESKETLSVNATGVAMLFSAGTFLYVATVHVLPELMYRGANRSGGVQTDGELTKGLPRGGLFCLVCGALLPLLLTMGHSH
uniref:Zinc transporter ZIP9 n=1 Tax=Timema shepardi TaxID=629360 RepID=A0A7R9B380_TIMSH|nr:unnamed protein product [Timema shepardi]